MPKKTDIKFVAMITLGVMIAGYAMNALEDILKTHSAVLAANPAALFSKKHRTEKNLCAVLNACRPRRASE